MSHEIEIQIIAVLVATGCATVGIFLVLQGKAMITDSVSHSILPGIAAGFLLSGSLSSPLLVFGALVAAAASAVCSEALSRGRLMSKDSSIAFVYPFLFSIGVVLVSGYAGNAHLDVDAVLLGEIVLAPLDRIVVGGNDLGPVSLYSSGAVVLMNGVFVALFYKELKLLTFDPEAAKAAGFSGSVLLPVFSTIVCITCIVSFEAVGSVLLIALVATPPCCALLLTNRLSVAVALSLIIAGCAAVAGFHAAVFWNTNIAGAITSTLGAVFLLILVFAPEKGVVSRVIENRRRRKEIETAFLLEHMARGAERKDIQTVCREIMWKRESALAVVQRAQKKGYVETDGRTIRIMEPGRDAVQAFASRFNL